MKAILNKYNISEERSQEIADMLCDIEDFSLFSNLDVIKTNVHKYLGLTAKNEIAFINEICEITYHNKSLYTVVLN